MTSTILVRMLIIIIMYMYIYRSRFYIVGYFTWADLTILSIMSLLLARGGWWVGRGGNRS